MPTWKHKRNRTRCVSKLENKYDILTYVITMVDSSRQRSTIILDSGVVFNADDGIV